MEDIKQELRQDNLAVKSNAIAKLTYVSKLYKFYLKHVNLCVLLVTNAGLRYILGRL